jgi:hypothetical protein
VAAGYKRPNAQREFDRLAPSQRALLAISREDARFRPVVVVDLVDETWTWSGAIEVV